MSLKMWQEPGRSVPVVEACDVLVCGGGPAGIAAAVSAARAGAKTILLEREGCLGGVWTAGCLACIIDAHNKGGVMAEILRRLQNHGPAAWDTWWCFAHDVEIMKLVLEEMLLEAGVRIRLHTHVAAAAKDADGRLILAITESKSGREAWAARCFVDCSGDGDLGAFSGAAYEYGDPETGGAQPLSLLGIVSGVRLQDIREYVRDQSCNPAWTHGQRLGDLLRSRGVNPSYGNPSLGPIREDLFLLGVNHQYEASGLNADDITSATLEARAELHRVVEALRGIGGVWANLYLVMTAEKIGVRDGRRIAGSYRMTVEDLVSGKHQEDAICRVTFPVDVHPTKKVEDGSFDDRGIRSKDYDIPLRALIARDVDGLLLAGRCISGDFLAHASYRVTGNAVAMGEAAGILGALAAATGRLPREVRWEEVRGALETICGRGDVPEARGYALKGHGR